MNINRILDSCKTSLHNMYRDIFERDNFVSAEKLKNAYLGISTDNTMLLELFNQHNKDVESLLGINKTKATLQKY